MSSSAANPVELKSALGVPYNVKCRLDHYHQPQHKEGRLIPWLWDDAGPFHTIMRLMSEWWLTVPDKDGWPLWCTAAKLKRTFEQIGGAVPACTCSMAITGFLKYFTYSGDHRYRDLARHAGDYLLNQALTPDTSRAWPRFPWPSGQTGSIHPDGSGHPYCSAGQVMPDKGAMAGYALLQLYKATNEENYLQTARHIADLLVKHAVAPSPTNSPWPFRVDADTGATIDGPLSGNQAYSLMLFDELLERKLATDPARMRTVRNQLQHWLTDVVIADSTGRKWENFFEDHSGNEDNPTAFSALEMAKYLLAKKQALHPHWFPMVGSILTTVKNRWTVHSGDYVAIGEQDRDMSPYNSHTARLAAVQALYYEMGGDPCNKEDALSSLAYAAYSVDKDGFADTYYLHDISWTTDSFGDLIVHFVEALGAVPEWAPCGQNHVLRSSSVIQDIQYGDRRVTYRTFDPSGSERLKVISKPTRIAGDSKTVEWTWDEQRSLLEIVRDNSCTIAIDL